VTPDSRKAGEELSSGPHFGLAGAGGVLCSTVRSRTHPKGFAGLRPDGDDDGVLIFDRRERTGHVNRVKKSRRGSEAALP
jgi:hypothetical protein